MQRPGSLAGIHRANRFVQVTRRRRIDALAQHLMEQRIQQWCNATHEIPWPTSFDALIPDAACLP